jgi:hypothetical protein
MTGRPGFLGGLRQNDAQDRNAEAGLGVDPSIGNTPQARLGDPEGQRSATVFDSPRGFHPIWGTLGAPAPEDSRDVLGRDDGGLDGPAVDVEIFGDGLQISGQIHTGQFDRLTDWINMQTGFVQVRDALNVEAGQTAEANPDQRTGTLWVRLDQIVLVAERSPVQQDRPGAPVVQKVRRAVSIVTRGYRFVGGIHVHAHGSMTQYLESPDPHFLAVTDLAVHRLSDDSVIAQFPFATINREQMVTVLDDPASSLGPAEQDVQIP